LDDVAVLPGQIIFFILTRSTHELCCSSCCCGVECLRGLRVSWGGAAVAAAASKREVNAATSYLLVLRNVLDCV
jgi:hypothetical protein